MDGSLLASIIPGQIGWNVGEAEVVLWRPEEDRPTVATPAVETLGHLLTIVNNLARLDRAGSLLASRDREIR